MDPCFAALFLGMLWCPAPPVPYHPGDSAVSAYIFPAVQWEWQLAGISPQTDMAGAGERSVKAVICKGTAGVVVQRG